MQARIGVGINRIRRIGEIRKRYSENIRKANPEPYDRFTKATNNVYGNINGYTKSDLRELNDARKGYMQAYTTQVSRRTYMGLSNG